METTQAPRNGWIHFIYLFLIYLFVAVATSGLFLVARSGGYSLVAVHRLLPVVASLGAELGL